MADLKALPLKKLLEYLKENQSKGVDVRRRLDEIVEEIKERNEQLGKAVGDLETRHRHDEYRVEDLIELRDKINDGFAVLEENEVR